MGSKFEEKQEMIDISSQGKNTEIFETEQYYFCQGF